MAAQKAQAPQAKEPPQAKAKPLEPPQAKAKPLEPKLKGQKPAASKQKTQAPAMTQERSRKFGLALGKAVPAEPKQKRDHVCREKPRGSAYDDEGYPIFEDHPDDGKSIGVLASFRRLQHDRTADLASKLRKAAAVPREIRREVAPGVIWVETEVLPEQDDGTKFADQQPACAHPRCVMRKHPMGVFGDHCCEGCVSRLRDNGLSQRMPLACHGYKCLGWSRVPPSQSHSV